MIPILFEKTANTFTTNGLGRLSDCSRCVVTEERNGIYECEFDYPVTGSLFGEIQIGRIIVSSHDENGDLQPFDIYHMSQPIDGIVTFYAHHISYRLNEIVVEPLTATTCATAIAALKSKSIGTNPFTFSTDKVVTADYEVTAPAILRGLLGGEQNSLLDVFGTGEYKFDNFAVSLLTRRGVDTDISIRYGKNLIGFENNLDYSDVYNAVVPYWLGSEYDSKTGAETTVLVTLTEKYIASGNLLPTGRTVFVPLDLSSDFESQPTEAELRAMAISKLSDSGGWLPSQNIKIDFVQLWQTEEYKDYAPLQKVSLCDTVLVSVPMYNIVDLRIKVIKVTWNVLLDRYDEMELGTPSTTFATVVTSGTDTKFDSTQLEINLLKELLIGQTDAKIQTWAQSSNPAADWTTPAVKTLHNGDLWLYTGTSTITIDGVTITPGGTYQYNSATGLWAAYSSPSGSLFDLVDGKTTIYYGPNTGSYPDVQEGDYLVDSNSGKTYKWDGSAWVLQLDYKGYTDSVVDSAIAFVEVQYCLSNSNVSFIAYGSWSTTLPTYVTGKYYWTRKVTYYNDGTNDGGSTPVYYQSGTLAAQSQEAFNSMNNHFWSDSSGAYVTEADGDYTTGFALKEVSGGVFILYNNNILSNWVSSGLIFYKPGGGQNPTSIAEFGANARIGELSDNNIQIDGSGLRLYKNYTEVGSLLQKTNYEPDYASATYNNALFLNAVQYFAILLDSTPIYGQNPRMPIMESNGEDIYFTFKEGDLLLTDTGNNGSVSVILENPNSGRTSQATWFKVQTETKGVWLGINSGNNLRGVYCENNAVFIIGMNASNKVFSRPVYSQTTTGTANVNVNSDGELQRHTSSSRRYKKDIEEIKHAEDLYDVKVRQFRYRDDYLMSDDQRYGKIMPGFIVEELEEVYPIAVDYNPDGSPEDWNAKLLIPAMLKLIQDQREEIEELKRRVDALEGRL